MTNIRITIEHDVDCPHPYEPGGHNWKPISFLNRHVDYQDPETVLNDPALKEKFEQGFAYLLDYYEHGIGNWSINGEGSSCQWDNSSNAGILIWEHQPEDMGAKTPAERKKDAELFLRQYSDWCNGHCHYFTIHKVSDCSHCGHEITEEIEIGHSSQGDVRNGFWGDDIEDGLEQSLIGIFEEYPDAKITYAGDGAYYGNHVKLPNAA